MRIPLFDDASTLTQTAGAPSLLNLHPGLFYTAVEQSSMAISITDAGAHIIYTNLAFRLLTGYGEQELGGANHNILASRQTPRKHYQDMWSALNQGLSWNGQLINKRKNGSLYLAEVSISPIFGADGQIAHYLGMHKDISDSYALMQRLRNQMSLIAAVLNNVPAPVVVLDEHDRIVMDNLAYKTLCADYGGGELLAALGYPENKTTLAAGERVIVKIGGVQRYFSLNMWQLAEVNEEISRYFSDVAPPRTLVTLIDDSEQQRQRAQQRLEQLKHKLVSGKLLAAIRESLDAAMIQLSGPMNMLAAERRLRPDGPAHPGLDAALQEGQQALVRLRACRPSLEQEENDFWSIGDLLMDLSELYLPRIRALGEMQWRCEPDILLGWGRRHQVLAALSLWLDRCLILAAERPAMPLIISLHAFGQDNSYLFALRDNLPLLPAGGVTVAHTFTLPGHGMELRLMQTLIGNHQGMIDLHTQEEGGTVLTLRLPLPPKPAFHPVITGESV